MGKNKERSCDWEYGLKLNTCSKKKEGEIVLKNKKRG